MEICRYVTTRAPVTAVFGYLADFTTTTEWDPGTVRTTLNSGDGAIGTSYENVSRFLGRETRLTYIVEEFAPDSLITFRGENASVVARDTMTFTSTASGGTQVTYSANFAFKGLVRLFVPLFAPAFRRLGDKAERGMRDALDKLVA